VCLPILVVAMVVAARRTRSWRPVVVAVGAVLALNFVVGILKIGLGRGQPESADPSFFVGGMAYPSGHTSNILLVYGLIVYLLGRYAGASRRTRVALWTVVAVLSMTMVGTSLTLNWHWFADLVAGLLCGAMVLQLTVAVDLALPATAYDDMVKPVVRRTLDRVRRRRPQPPVAPKDAAPGP
jgi:undecaprenyl-diphosphatase